MTRVSDPDKFPKEVKNEGVKGNQRCPSEMEQYLCQMMLEVSKQIQALERECLLLRDLLKPWRKKKSKENDGEKEKQESVKGHETTNHGLSQEERQALLQVDELLLKAQKTRQLKTKTKLVATPDETSRILDETALSGGKHNADSDSVNHSSNSSGDSRSNSHSTEGGLFQSDSKKFSNATASSRLQKEIQHKSSSNNTSKTKNVATIHQVNRNNTTPRVITPKSGNSRPPSSNASVRPTSAKGRHVPAHMSAPFKTDAYTRVPKRRLNHLQKNGSKIVAGKSMPSGVSAYRTLPGITNNEQSSQGNKNSEMSCKIKEQENIPDDQGRLDGDGPNIDEIHDDTSRRQSGGIVKDISKAQENLNWNSLSSAQDIAAESTEFASEYRDWSEHTIDEDAAVRETEADLFSLKQNGSSLTVPGKLSKAVAINNSLRDRCSTAGLTRRVSKEDVAQQFADKLDAQCQIGPELWSRVCATTCLQSHEILLETLHSLQLDQLSDHTSYNDIYRAKRLLEFVLTTFAELQREADYFFNVQFRKIKAFPKAHVEQRETQQEWLDTESLGEIDKNHLQGYLSSSKDWADLKFKEKYLNLHIFLISLADSEWWNFLLNQNSFRDPRLLQSVYGFLTTCGQFLPAMIENPDVG